MKKKVVIIFLIAVLCAGGVAAYKYYKYNYFNNEVFYTESKVSFENSTHHFNGTWWGFNQSKIVRINDIIFTYYINNDLQIGEVANKDNPNQMVFVMIKSNGQTVEFDQQKTSRPGNVVADPNRNLVYYFMLEPTSSQDSGTLGKLMMYTYSFEDDDIELIKEEIIVDHDGTNPEKVNTRFSATIDSSGNLAITYAVHDTNYVFSMYVLTYDIDNGNWTEKSVYIEGLQHPNFYPEVAMKDLDHFLVVAVQDYCHHGDCYYQYVRYFLYENGEWTYDYLVDYQNETIASKRPNLVSHTEVYLGSNDSYHVLTVSRIEKDENDKLVNHFIFDKDKTEIVNSEFEGSYNFVRIVEVNNELYYVAVDSDFLYILHGEKYDIIHKAKLMEGAYPYVISSNENDYFDLLLSPGFSEAFNDVDNLYLRLGLCKE
ncbi:hypothetical protein KHQ81_01265 [Mycoplasmatota bacterium]|nr:hypothetical protein KHQ81_01265 [Mycoplasmatota bacterium]